MQTLSLTLILTLMSLTTSTDPVIIIGAGISGARAALHLSQNKIPFILLEATDRVGGRLRTQKLGKKGPTIELGANWMQGFSTQDPHPIYSFIQQYIQLKSTAMDYDDTYFYKNGSRVPGRIANPVWQKASLAFETMHSSGEVIKQAGLVDARSVRELLSQFIPREPIEIAAWRNFFEFEYAVPDSQVSATGLSALYGENVPADREDLFVNDERGFDEIVHVLLQMAGVKDTTKSGNKLQLNSPVSRVEYGQGNATVTLRNGRRVKGSAVICTVSIGVLKDSIRDTVSRKKRLVFEPELSIRKRIAIGKLGMADFVKVFLQFRTAVFSKRDPLSMIGSGCEVEDKFIRIQNLNKEGFFEGENVVILFATDSFGRQMGCMGEEEVVEEGLKYVSRVVGRVVGKDEVKAVLVAEFGGEFFRGSYSVTAPGVTEEDLEVLGMREGNLFFGGEGVSKDGLNGYVQGAWDSGVQVGKQVVSFLK